MITQTIIEAVFTAGQTVYAIIRNRLNGHVWNTNTQAFEAFNSGNWAQYAIPLTEQAGSGYYSAARPSGVSGFLTSDSIYQQGGGSPTLGDTPATNILYGAGDNIAGMAGDGIAASRMQAALSTESEGTVASGTISASQFPTSLTDVASNLYQGRVLIMTSGLAAKCASIIASYNPTGGVIGLTAPLAVTPSLGDAFVIV